MERDSLRQYLGLGAAGSRLDQPPLFEPLSTLRDPRFYVASHALGDAVNVAIRVGMPLLLTGDPGTGKTELAHSLAWELGLPGPLVFNAKTTSTAQDLFYRYDALRHFHDSRFSDRPTSAEDYIDFEALGIAILLSMPASEADPYLPAEWRGKGPLRTVVLIDEIDKAPRDLPNDVLNEIERMTFVIRETGRQFPKNGGRTDSEFRPIVVMTSNSEKHLPDAFLRRCAYYHIPFPEEDDLRRIIAQRMPFERLTPLHIAKALDFFFRVRSLGLTRSPATAELLNWLAMLDRSESDANRLDTGQFQALAHTMTLLIKNREDIARLSTLVVHR